jgi:hypothetical protein
MTLAISIVKNLVREYLNEADAYARKFEKRFDQSNEIKPYIDVYEDGIIKYAIRMTKVAKLGIKPTFEWANARGIYAYPLTSEIYNGLLKSELPYADDEENFIIFEIKDAKRWLNVSAPGKHKNWKDICKTMLDYANKKLGESNKLSFEDALSSAEQGIHWSVSNGAKIWDFGYALAQLFPESQRAAAWQYMLLAAGFDGAYDAFKGVMHENEPSQLAAWKLGSIRQVGIYDTKTFKRGFVPLKDNTRNPNFRYTLSQVMEMNTSQKTGILYNNPETLTADVLAYLAKERDTNIKKLVAGQPNTPTEVLTKLGSDKDVDVMKSVFSNENCPKDVFQKILDELLNSNENDKRWLASDPRTPIEALEKLVSEGDKWIRLAAAGNRNLPPSILLKLAKDSDDQVRKKISYSLSHRAKVPIEALLLLAKDSEEDVRKYALEHPSYEKFISGSSLSEGRTITKKQDCTKVQRSKRNS